MNNFTVNPAWEERIDIATATGDVQNFINSRDFAPSRAKKEMENHGELLAEAVRFGYLNFNTDGSVLQTLRNPILNAKGDAVVVGGLTYKARVNAQIKSETVRTLQPLTVMNQIATYAELHTGQARAILQCIDGYDADVMNKLTSLFF